MRRLATTTALALVLGVAPLSLATAAAAAAPAAVTPAAAQTGQWVNTGETYPQQWICVYVGNQKVTSGQAVNFSCPAGPAGSYALWILTP
ncbi:hypothetical protein VSR01_00640 [Actinacidiphila sp. DG2A-62]|uniref:hypothetical protein n=1 Tax=Actinacidiphila sp. DG2A-62 TaxID=3108821 RepID=UPI002DB69F66|nr:hypothetical protein [Actinacidiphila sp. DG2A-62]MEC3992129.1 hypothetical protein [Actinacidiphila sp. DG2A-62]